MAVAGTVPVAAAPMAMVSTAGMVARTMASTTTPTAGSVNTCARKRVKNVPCRIGRSTRKKESIATPMVGMTRTTKRGQPLRPVRCSLMKVKSGKCQRYMP